MRFRSTPAVLTTLLFSAVLLLSACTDQPDDVPTAQPTPSATPTVSSDEQEKAAAVAAFVKGIEVFDSISLKGGSSDARSQLEPYFDGEFLDLLTASLANTKTNGGRASGEVARWATAKSSLSRENGDMSLQLVVCADYSKVQGYDKNGEKINPRSTDYDLGEVTMVKEGTGNWKATEGNSDPVATLKGTPCDA